MGDLSPGEVIKINKTKQAGFLAQQRPSVCRELVMGQALVCHALFHFKRGGQQGKKAVVNTNIAKETELRALGSFASSNGDAQGRHEGEFRRELATGCQKPVTLGSCHLLPGPGRPV